MKIKKFAQNCMLIDYRNVRILIDPGNVQYFEGIEDLWTSVNIILVTHMHATSCHADVIKKIIERDNALLYTTREVLNAYPDLKGIAIKEGDKINLSNYFSITATHAVHGYLPHMKGHEVRENIGFLIDDSEKKIYIAGDTICFPNDYKCDYIFMPFQAHGITMGVYDGLMFAREMGAKLIIPTNLEDPTYPTDIDNLVSSASKYNLKLNVLKPNDEIEL